MRNRFDDGGFAQDPSTDILPDDQSQGGFDPGVGSGSGGSTGGGFSISDLIKGAGRLLGGTSDAGKWGQLGAFMGLAGLANQSSFFNAPPTRVGYQGGIPQFTATRTQTPYMAQRGPDYRPGQGGVTYFEPTSYQYSGGDIGIPAKNIYGGGATAGGQTAGGGTAAIPGGGITEGDLRRVLGADYNRIMGISDTGTAATTTPGTMYTGGTPGFNEATGTYTPPATTGGISTLPGTTGGVAYPYTSQQTADMARQAIAQDTSGTRGTVTPPPAVDTSAQDAAQAKYNAEAAANLYKKPEYGANFNFDRRFPQSWGVVTGSLEDRIFRQFGDLTGRYTSQQISPDEVKGLADRVRAGTLKEADVGAAISAAEAKKKSDAAAAAAQAASQAKPATALENYFKSLPSQADLEKSAQSATFKVGTSPYGQEIRSGQIGVTIGDDGTPRGFAYYDKSGKLLTGSAFNPREFLRNAQEFNINPIDLLGIEKGLKTNKIGYMPYEMYGGGGDLGFDIRDLLSGGLGSASNWYDYVNSYKPTGVNAGTDLFNKQYLDIANKLGLKYNQEKYKGGGIDPSRVTAISAEGVNPRNWAMIGPNNSMVAMYETKEEAEAAAKQYGGTVKDVSQTNVSNLDNPNQLQRDAEGKIILRPGGARGGLGSLIRKGYAQGGMAGDFYSEFDNEPTQFKRQPAVLSGDQQFSNPLVGIGRLMGGMPRGEGVPGIVNRGIGAGVGPYTPPDTLSSPYPGTQYVAEPPAAYIPPPPPSPAPAPIPPPPAVYTQPGVVHPMTTPGVSQDVQDLINMYTQTGSMGEPDMNQVMTPYVPPGGSPGLVNPVSFNPSDFGGLIGDTQEADAKAKLGDVTGFTKEQAQQKALTTATPGATYEQVMQAYQSNPFAVKAPDESAINYWMSQGLGSFGDVVNQARGTDPALAARIDAERTQVQRPGEGAYSIAALGDSTTYGYNQGQQLPNNMVTSAEDYLHSVNPNISIQNYGQTATTLGDALNSDVFDRALKSDAGTILLNYGLNESYRNVDPQQFAADLDAAIKRAKAAGKNVVLQTPNPVGSSAASDWASDLDQYVQAIREAAARNNVALHDKYSYGQSLGDVTSQGDPTHPTGKAYTQFGTNLGKFLESYLYGKPPGGAAGGLGSMIQAKGGRFLRGPGDGVSDSIEAQFTKSGEPARLADGEFVIDARTVSELGNGSSEAGARKLYAMMDRVHKMRKKAKRGEPSGADKSLPA